MGRSIVPGTSGGAGFVGTLADQRVVFPVSKPSAKMDDTTGVVSDQAEVSPVSKPSANIGPSIVIETWWLSWSTVALAHP
jgi:hypothetical protein